MASKTIADSDPDESDKMSIVSKCSNFSLKFQQYIAKQDGQMAAMRKAMIAAGLDPDLVMAGADADAVENEGMEVDVTAATNSKKRLPSGSPRLVSRWQRWTIRIWI